MQKIFTDAYIRKLNELCKQIKCNNECDGIGWCPKVFDSVYIPPQVKDKVSSHERTR